MSPSPSEPVDGPAPGDIGKRVTRTSVGESESAPRGRTGRRPGNPDTRAAILDAARVEFAEKGFTRATMRSIARRAGVDPSLLHHYFGTKNDLFFGVVNIPFDPTVVVSGLLQGERHDLGIRLVTAVLTIWDSPLQPTLLAVLRGGLIDEVQSRNIREFLGVHIIGRVLVWLEVPPHEIERRAGFAASQILGVILLRYLVRQPPLATLPIPTIAATIGPVLQNYLTGPLPEA